MWISDFIKGLKQNEVIQPKPPVIHTFTKPRLAIELDTTNTRKWTGIVWHHSATKDDLVHKDIDGIIQYQKSFRIDFNSVALPQKDEQQGIEYVKYKNGEYYKKPEHDRYFAELKKKEANSADKRYFELAWLDVGYNGLIESASDKYIFRYGRPLSMIGAHAGYKEFNENYIGLCAVGNFDKDQVSRPYWEFALMVTRTFMDKFLIPVVNVLGHREVYDKMGVPRQKQCPGKYWNMDYFRSCL